MHIAKKLILLLAAGTLMNRADNFLLRDQGAWRRFEMLPQRQSDRSNEIVLYEKGARRTEYTRRQLTERIVVELAPGADAQAIAVATESHAASELSYAPGHFIFHARSAADALALAERLRAQEGVLSANPILARKLKPRHLPNDLLFTNQWHLLNTGQHGATPGADIRVTNVWERFRGTGVIVGVVDDGVQYIHPDLAANVDLSLGIDIRDGDSDPKPQGFPGALPDGEPLADSHGTAVAGIIAARGDNQIGIAGVAYEAIIAPVRLLGPKSGDDEEGEALSQEQIQISNNSWGADDDGETVGGAGDLALLAMKHGAETGRGGKGTIYVFAAGNGGELEDNANYDSYANSIYTIAVGAINDRGNKATYSERGTCLIVSAPGGNDGFRFQGITTTDLLGNYGYNRSNVGTPLLPELQDRDYSQMFSGTSASAPVVSGVAALVLQANPELGWRDMQEILMRSATKTAASDREWFTNAAGMRFNPKFGGGLVNAEGAVQLALNWRNLPSQTNIVFTQSSIERGITVDSGPLELAFENGHDLRVEHVTLHVNITAAARGRLQILLQSPAGTISPLAEPRVDPNSDYDFTFMSVFHWGEEAHGTWKVRIEDTGYVELEPDEDIPAIVHTVSLAFYGSTPHPTILSVRFEAPGFHLRIAGTAGKIYEMQRSGDFLTWETIGKTTAVQTQFEMIDPETLTQRAFYRAVEVKN